MTTTTAYFLSNVLASIIVRPDQGGAGLVVVGTATGITAVCVALVVVWGHLHPDAPTTRRMTGGEPDGAAVDEAIQQILPAG
ncbi:MAG TPA: hypothetical protein VFB58_12455 [Chloroflexota bacterium]|nr:hypothetical protein [Chloroflexota bacterium]